MSPDPGASPAPKSIAELLAPHATAPPPRGTADAAVLIVLRPPLAGTGVDTLLIERAVRATDPGSGQIALPGGRVDAADRDLRETALREAEEEVGLPPSGLRAPPVYVGRRPAAAFGLEVAVFAAELAPGAPAPHARAADEVASVFWLPYAALTDARRVRRATSLGEREVDATVHDGRVVWGFTRRVLREFYGFRDPAWPNPLPPAASRDPPR